MRRWPSTLPRLRRPPHRLRPTPTPSPAPAGCGRCPVHLQHVSLLPSTAGAVLTRRPHTACSSADGCTAALQMPSNISTGATPQLSLGEVRP